MTDSASPTRRPNRDLTGRHKRYLRGLAHHILPVVQVGREGVTDGVIAAVTRALRDHELIKVKVLESSPDDRRRVAPQLVAACGAHDVGQIGRIVVLYREHDTDPTIRFPK